MKEVLMPSVKFIKERRLEKSGNNLEMYRRKCKHLANCMVECNRSQGITTAHLSFCILSEASDRAQLLQSMLRIRRGISQSVV